jgi:Gas vesicle synthesis protein GvpL/GvpF
MTDTLVYLYAVGDASLHDAAEPGTMTGVDGAPVRTIRAGGLAAAVSSVDRARFSTVSLRRTPEDLRQLEDIAQAHHDVVDALARAVALVPMPLATLHANDDNVQAILTEKAAEFSTALARIRGRTEWGVKAFAVEPSQAPEATVASGAGPGTSYLPRNRAERTPAVLRYQQAVDAAEELHREITRLAVASRRYPPQDPPLSGRREEMMLNTAYLVTESAAARLRRLVNEEWHAPSLRLELTGPSAAHSFATLD